MSIETQRQLSEDLNALEKASAQRFRRNPALRAAAGVRSADEVLESKPKRPHRETLSQQHELAYFQNQYELDAERCRKTFSDNSLATQIAELKDPEMSFKHILSIIQDIDKTHYGVSAGSASSIFESFSMYSSAPKEENVSKKGKVKRKHHLSTATEYIDAKLKQTFTESETYGKYVDLTLFYEMHKSIQATQQTYVEFLQNFAKLEHIPKSPDSSRYLESLLGYLKQFHANAFPLASSEAPNTTKAPDLGSEPESQSQADDGKPNADGEVYCKFCDKLFAKESVYKGHLSGKKHKKNEEMKKNSSDTPKAETKPGIESVKSEIKCLADQLKPVFDNTINDYQRRSRFSEREQQLERIAVEGELSDFTSIDSDSAKEESDDDDIDDMFSKDLPLGADGIPIPLWLYKLQGLHRSYSCEVCGNHAYKGRQQFNKHFGQPKHVHGLMCLGVSEEDTGLFANISTIAEVQDLWERVKKSKNAEMEDEENNVEVEDEDGNVMSRKDYEELKKQGLI
ncbi:hypothetical protein OY671_004069 [Metschnikowia pulcherrima]|nr:hypothetical protein OY671_004069 [Metschnikowia pulcherrima]